MTPNISTSSASSSIAATTQAPQPPARALETTGAASTQQNSQGPLQELSRRPPEDTTQADAPRRGGRRLLALGVLGASATAAGLLVRDGMGRSNAASAAAQTEVLLGAPSVMFSGIAAAYALLRTSPAPRVDAATLTASPAPRVDDATLRAAIDTAMGAPGQTSGPMLYIVNHIRDYRGNNEVSPEVARAIEQAQSAARPATRTEAAAPTGDIEAPPHAQAAQSEVASQIVLNLQRLVTANPPILPRGNAP